jgi:hypothetical protein
VFGAWVGLSLRFINLVRWGKGGGSLNFRGTHRFWVGKKTCENKVLGLDPFEMLFGETTYPPHF